jgi:hypothetical protein
VEQSDTPKQLPITLLVEDVDQGGGRTFADKINTTGLMDRKASRTAALRVSGCDSAACGPVSGEAGAR